MGFLEEGAAGWSKGCVLAWGHGAAKPCEPEVLLPGPARGLPAHAVPTPRDSLVARKVYFCLDGLKGVPRSQVPCTKSPSKSLRVALFLTPGWN